MNRPSRILPILALATACATAPPVAPEKARLAQATQPLPAAARIEGEAERGKLTDATIRAALGDAARDSGNVDAARAEWKKAGVLLVELSAMPSRWRLVYLASGARYLQISGEYDASARAAERLGADPEADSASRAMAARARALALHQLAAAEVKAGKLEPLSNATADRRKGKKLDPRPPAETWKRLLDADDAYVAAYRADTEPNATENAAQAAFQAALIQYSHDNMEDAARRFWAVIDGFPSSKAMGEAVTMYLQTFQVRGDWAGLATALDRSLAAVGAQARRPAAGPEARAQAEAAARQEEQLLRDKQGLGYGAANRLLNEGKFKEALAAYDAFVAANPDHPDAPAALYNGAIAAERSGEARKAQAAREKVLSRYPEARVAPKAALALAGAFSRSKDHGAAARLYALYIDKYPAGEDRCLAMFDVGIELWDARQHADAASRYVAYGTDPRCAKDDPNQAAGLLYRAAAYFSKSGKRDETQAAFRALVALPGVTDPAARSYVDEARGRVK